MSEIRPLYVPGELLVKTRAALSAADAEAMQETLGARVVRTLDMPPEMQDRFGGSLYQVRLPDGKSVEQAIAEMRRQPGVEYAEPNYVVHELEQRPGHVPDDLDPKLWGLYNPPARADIHAPEAWTVTTGKRAEEGGPLIAVIDTGLDMSHPDLASGVFTNPREIAGDGIDNDGNGYVDDVHGWDFANQDNDPTDDKGHGTHVCGTIAAEGNNGQGVVGVAWRATLIPLKFLGQFGGTIADAISAISYATAMGARVTSNSWGGGGYSQALHDAMKASPALHICAAGNDGRDNDVDPVYPAAYDLDNIVTVAATDRQDGLASFSNWGQVGVDLAAPGVDTFSTLPGGQYGVKSGTSMATPHVTGTAALILSEHPDLTNEALKARLMYSTDRLPALDHKVVSGGRLNAERALAADVVPPSPPTGLGAVEASADHVTLAWKAGGDDGTVGTAAGYELRFSDRPIAGGAEARPGETTWRNAQPFPGVPYPEASGTEQRVTVPLLPSAEGTSWHFALRARDRVGNVSETVQAEARVPGLPMAFRDDFERGAAGWEADGTWAVTSDNGNHFFSDSPGTDYPSNNKASLTSPVIDLGRVRAPKLSYATKYHVEPRFDHVSVEITADGGKTWTELEQFSGKAPWGRRTCDLAAFEGQAVRIRFRLVSDGDIEYDGLSVDDVIVTGEPG